MIILMGITEREKRIGSGEFFCPHCQVSRGYRHMRRARYFTLFFIPLFRIHKLGEHVKCDFCSMDFNMDVLR